MLLLVAVALSTVATYLFTMLAGRVLGPADYGVLAALLAIATITSLPLGALQMGLSAAVSDCLAREEFEKALAISRGVFRMSLYFAIAVGILFLAVAAPLAQLLQIDSVAPVAALAPAVALPAVLLHYMGELQGRQRFGRLAWATCLPAVLRLVLFVVFVLLGFHLYGAIAASVMAGIAIVFICGYWCSYIIRRDTNAPPAEIWPFFRGLVPIAVAVGAITALTQIDILIVKGALSSSDAGLYAAASTLSRLALFVPITLTSILFPRVTVRMARGEESADILGRTLIATGAFCVVLFGSLSAFGGPVVRLAFGDKFSPAAELLPLFGLGTSFFCVAYVLASYDLARSAPLFAWVLAAGAAADAAVLGLFHRTMEEVLWVNAGIGLALIVAHQLLVGGTAHAVGAGARHFWREARYRRGFRKSP